MILFVSVMINIEDEENIYYVAATRGRKQIIFDVPEVYFDETAHEITDKGVSDNMYGKYTKHFGTLEQFIQKKPRK